MRVVLHGVRGSTPASGAEFAAVGGRTSCVAITPAGRSAPTLLLDAGTGLSNVSASLGGQPYRGVILLSHLHWDHVQGLPFFTAGDRDDSDVRLILPAQAHAAPGRAGTASALLAGMMSPPYFPITPEGLLGRWSFEAVDVGPFSAGGCDVSALEVPHKGGRTFGYRVEADGASLAYLPDHNPSADMAPGVELATGVDVLLHGGMFSESEAELAHSYGHATVGEAHRLARAAGVAVLVLIHHAPSRTDAQVQQLAAPFLDSGLRTEVGREGDVVLDTASAG